VLLPRPEPGVHWQMRAGAVVDENHPAYLGEPGAFEEVKS
jgi:hypothetical protein